MEGASEDYSSETDISKSDNIESDTPQKSVEIAEENLNDEEPTQAVMDRKETETNETDGKETTDSTAVDDFMKEKQVDDDSDLAAEKDTANDSQVQSSEDLQEGHSVQNSSGAKERTALDENETQDASQVETNEKDGASTNVTTDSSGKGDVEETKSSDAILPASTKDSESVSQSDNVEMTAENKGMGSQNENKEENVENEEMALSSDTKKDDEVASQITSDILTQDMQGGHAQKGHESSIEGSVGDKDRTVKTPESIAVSVDLPENNLAPSQSRMSNNRPVTSQSEFIYNEHDFPTPDYEMYGPTPTTVGSDKMRQLSPTKRTVSRGEGAKSVTFADDVSKSSDTGNKETSSVSEQDLDQEAAKEPSKDETEKEEESKEEQDKTQENEESKDIFPTAVSEEKIAEAKRKQQESFTQKESLAIELFGASKFEPESMEDVVTKKAFQHFESGCRLMDEGDYCQAIISLDKALNLLPKEVKFYLMRGEAYLQLCDFQSAILNLKKACVLKPDNHEYYARLAFVYYFQGQSLFDQCLFPEALESFSRAAEMRPEIIAYHTRSIACLAALQRHGECLALVNKRLETDRTNPDLYIMRARLHQLFRNTTLCYYDLKDALALDPDQEEARAMMKELEQKAEENKNHATRLQLLGKFKDSLTKITIAIEMNPSVSDYHLQRGALHRRLHDYNAAIDDFLLAMDKTEHNEYSTIYTDAQRQLLLTYNDFAVECFVGGHFEEAILLLNKALKGEKREKGLYINRGDCFFRLQELHFALADYHQASELDASDAGIRSRVAAIHNQFGLQDYEEHNYQDAEGRFTIAIQHNPKHGAYYISRCKVRLMMENQTGARQDFLIGLHLDSSNIDILSLMPRIYPGKSVGDVMRTKQAKEAKVAADNAVITASPVILPSVNSGDQDNQESDGMKRVNFAPGVTPDSASPPLKFCMTEQDFNKALTKQKKQISNHVKSLLHDRPTTMHKDKPKLKPIPPPRPYAVRGGHWKNPEPSIKPGWKTFSLGIGLME